MNCKYIYCFILLFHVSLVIGQTNSLDKFKFLLGDWEGNGIGFGNEKSKIKSSFKLVMDDHYIEVKNDSKFESTTSNPEGETHSDIGFISYDSSRNLVVFRQFNKEGYINQYILNDSLSDDKKIIFVTESIENFVPGGKAKWTIKKISDKEIETIFDVYFPNKGFSCMGTNNLYRKE